MSKHNSYALKNFAELSATLKGLTNSIWKVDGSSC